MKRIFATLLTLCMLLSFAARAEPAAQNAEANAESVVIFSGDAFRLYYKPVETTDDDVAEYALYALEYAGEGETDGGTEICPSAVRFLWDEGRGLLYYAPAGDDATLYSYAPETETTALVFAFNGEIEALRLCCDGLLVTAGGKELLHADADHAPTEPPFSFEGMTVFVGDGYDALLDADGALSLRMKGSETATSIGSDVVAADIGDGMVFSMTERGGKFALKSYTMESGAANNCCDYPEDMVALVEYGYGHVYAVSESGFVYDYALSANENAVLNEEPLNATQRVLEAFDGYVAVYDTADAARSARKILRNTDAQRRAKDGAAENADKSAAEEKTEEVTLARGSEGDDVAALQEGLIEKGYLSGKADGVFGWRTERAVKRLQSDLGVSQTGKATPDLCKKVASGDIPKYVRYVALSVGDEGIRVQELQQRLREKGYMTINAGGHYKSGTKDAVKRFQAQKGYKQTGNITAKQMKALFSKDCPENTQYYKLSKDESSPMILRLNKRLKHLGYFTGKAGECYTKHTAKAVKRFCTQNGYDEQSNSCSAKLQKAIFAKDAPPYAPEPDPDPPAEWKLPTEEDLNALREWINDHFDTDLDTAGAVSCVQQKLNELGFLAAEGITGTYDEATSKAVLAFQKKYVPQLSNPEGIARKITLTALFT